MIAEASVRLTKRLGVHETVRSFYWYLRLARIGWRQRVSLGPAEAEFFTTTRSETERARTLLGEEQVAERLLSDLRADDVFWDVGATVGTYSCLAASVLTAGTVVSIEPEPTNYGRLRRNLRLNATSHRWMGLDVALCDEDGRSGLVSERTEAGAGHHHLADDGGIDVRCRRGESLVAEGIPAPDMMKIDVQGAELDVLRGMGAALEGVRVLFIEIHEEKCERYDTRPDEVESYLRDAGFEVRSLGEPDWDRSGVYHVRAVRDSA